jgi:16S rRNA (guanine966-N2)-methyltransferase
MKETIFNILQAYFPGARVLDLYCGAGNLGLEAVSRQAALTVLVERDASVVRCLRQNIAALGLADRSDVAVVPADAIRYLQTLREPAFDVILADPPYDALVEDTLLDALRPQQVRLGGVFVFQHRSSWALSRVPDGFQLQRPRLFGGTTIDFLQRSEAADV